MSPMRRRLLLLSLKSCPTLCDPIDGSPPGSSVPGILQARTLEWVAISFSNAWKWKVKVKSLSRVQLFAIPWTAAYQAPPSMGFSRQEYWSGLPLPSPHESDTVGLFRLLFSRWVVSHCLEPQGLQHDSLPCSSLSDYLYDTSVQILCTICTTNFRFKTCFTFGSVITWALFEHLTEHLLLKFLYPSVCLDKERGLAIWMC